jgi:hypothetical protein
MKGAKRTQMRPFRVLDNFLGRDSCTEDEREELLSLLPGIEQDANGELHFAEWNCRAGQNNVIIRTDGTVAPCFPMYASTFDWGNIDKPKFDGAQLSAMKGTCQRHCFFNAEP